MSVDMPQRLAGVNVAAEASGLHPQTIRRYIKEGRLTGYRLGAKFLRVDLDEVEALVQPLGEAS